MILRARPRGVDVKLRPFWRYYGGKFRAAPRYPAPQCSTIIEPFAGAAGYSLRYHDRSVILIERYPVVAEIWRYLIGASAAEIRAIPYVEHVDDLPGWVPEGARHLVGFAMNSATVSPRRQMSAGRRQLAAAGGKFEGWSDAHRECVATQVEAIRHWHVIEGEWHSAPMIDATWYVDPPYNNRAGSHYVYGPDQIDYSLLARACTDILPGQVIVCENEGATWLPFRPFAAIKSMPRPSGGISREAIWTREVPA